MNWNIFLFFLISFLISNIQCGKSAKRGGRHDSGKLVATLCHYYSDGAMGCKECFEVARSHRSNHNSTLLPPCKSVQGIKRRNWTLEDGILLNAIIDTNATKRYTLASCAFYSNNRTFTCVSSATKPQCDHTLALDTECVNSTSWSGRFEGSISEGFRILPPPINGSKPAKHFNGTWTKLPITSTATTTATIATTTSNTTVIPLNTTAINATTNGLSSTLFSTTASSPSVNITTTSSSLILTGQASDFSNEVHKIPESTSATSTTGLIESKQFFTSETVIPSSSSTAKWSTTTVTANFGNTSVVTKNSSAFTLSTTGNTSEKPVGATSQKSSTLTSLVTTQVQSSETTEFSENCTQVSCTIFAETSSPTETETTTISNFSNETFVQDAKIDENENSVTQNVNGSSATTATSQLVAVSGWTTNSPDVDAVFNKGGSNISTTHFKMVLLDEVLTPTSGHDTSTATTATSPSTPLTTTMLVLPTFSSNATSSKHPEPRKRQPIRRMY